MNVFYIMLYFKDNETGAPFRMLRIEIALTREIALTKAHLQAQQFERDFDMTLMCTRFRGEYHG